jgi:hypothetical protein
MNEIIGIGTFNKENIEWLESRPEKQNEIKEFKEKMKSYVEVIKEVTQPEMANAGQYLKKYKKDELVNMILKLKGIQQETQQRQYILKAFANKSRAAIANEIIDYKNSRIQRSINVK